MAAEFAALLPVSQRPEPHATIAVASRQRLAVRRERHAQEWSRRAQVPPGVGGVGSPDVEPVAPVRHGGDPFSVR